MNAEKVQENINKEDESSLKKPEGTQDKKRIEN